MVNEKSLGNLKRGNTKNVGKKKGKTWKDLIDDIGNEAPAKEFESFGKTWREVLIRRAYWHSANGNAPILRELMQRSEPQDDMRWLLNIDLTKLPKEIVEQIANADDIRAVLVALASAGAVGAVE